MPLVSVIIPSYNHEAYIEDCINSVLGQTFQDFEIIITDDGSKDQTVNKILNFSDSRIKLFSHTENKGASIAANNCIKHASGKYIAMLSSDDVWMSEKLEVQVNYLEQYLGIGAVFGRVEWVDEKNRAIVDEDFPYINTFNVNNRTRHEWLNHFFFEGNCLCHPTSLIRSECYSKIGVYNPAFANLPDFDLWVRMCLEYEIHILDHKLIKYRWLPDNTNASSDTDSNRVRTRYELGKILNHYLKIIDLPEFLEIFPEATQLNVRSASEFPFILALLAINTRLNVKVLWGIDTIYDYFQDEEKALAIQKSHGFSYLDFIKLVGENDVFKIGDQYSYQPVPEHPQSKIDNKWINRFKSLIDPLVNLLKKLKRRINLKKDIELIIESGLFDQKWYLETYQDVKEARIDPARHYLLYGGFEGRDPSPEFNSQWYINNYDDVRAAGVNPLLHYLMFGIKEGREIKRSDKTNEK